MKTVFDKPVRDELIARIRSIGEDNKAQWGRMNIRQMLKHCTLWEEWILSGKSKKRIFIGRLFGKMALKTVLKNDGPLRRNTPTMPELSIRRMKEGGTVESEKTKWIGLIEQYAHFPDADFVHPFFGKMTKEQIGQMAYKHSDHHLRQFNV